jgi:hypothetical protein
MPVRRTLTVATVVLLVLSGTGVAAGGGGPTGDQLPDEGATGWTVTNVETGETYELAPGEPLDALDLPPGEYRAVRRVEVDRTVRVEERRFTVEADDDVSTAATGVEPRLVVEQPVITDDLASFRASETVRIWVGAVDGIAPVSGEEVTVEIRRPDGVMVTRNRTTNADGHATLVYDPPNDVTGKYSVSARANGKETYDQRFVLGPVTDLVSSARDTAEVDNPIRWAIQAAAGGQRIANATRSFQATGPDGTTENWTLTTDENGYATFTFTPKQTGNYEFAVNGTTRQRYGYDLRVGADTATAIDNTYPEPSPGETVTVGGVVLDRGEPASSRTIDVAIVNETNDTVATTRTVTTTAGGAFAVNWTVPDAALGHRFDIEFRNATGVRIVEETLYSFSVGPEGATTRAPDADVEVDLRWTDRYFYEIAPESSETAIVQVTDDGVPIADESVTIRTATGQEYDSYVEGVPVASRTVTTNASGKARVSIPVPSEAPAGGEFVVRASVSARNATVHDEIDATINDRLVEINTYGVPEPRAGEPFTPRVTVTNASTGAPIEGVSVPAAVVGGDEAFGTVESTTGNVTNKSGVARPTVEIPTQPPGKLALQMAIRGWPYTGRLIDSYLYDHEVRVNGDGYGATVRRTGTATIEYTFDTNATADGTALVYADSNAPDDGDELLAARPLDPGEELTVTVPRSAPNGTEYEVRIVAADANGVHDELFGGFTVQGGPGDRYVRVDGNIARVNDTATVDASVAPVPDGLQSYNITFALSNPEVADVAGVEPGAIDGTVDGNATFEVTAQTADTVTVEATDLRDDVRPGDGPVALADVRLNGTANGTTDVVARVNRFVEDDGTAVGRSLKVENGTFAVRGPRLGPSDVSVGPNETASTNVTLDYAPYGLENVTFSLSLANDSVADLETVSTPLAGGELAVRSRTSDSITVRVNDTADRVGGNDGPVALATVEVNGTVEGRTRLETTVSSATADGGTPTGFEPTAGTVNVDTNPFESAVPGTGASGPPTNVDDDPRLEDVNGDEGFTFIDVVTLLFADYSAINDDADQKEALNFDGSGNVGFLDVVALLFEL